MRDMPELPDTSFLDRPEILLYVFYPQRARPGPDIPGEREGLSFDVEGVNLDGTIHLAGKGAPNLLFFHGNGEVVADYDEIGAIYTGLGINFAVVDYRGYGTSGGFPTYSQMIRDAHHIFHGFLEFLEDRGLDGPVFVMGRSLGSASSLELAACYTEEVSGLILESGFAYTYNLLVNLGVDPSLLEPSKVHLVSNLEKMKKVEGPVLVIHGEIDEIIPASDGRTLYEVARNEIKDLLIIPGAGHNTLMLLGLDEYMEAVGRFVERALES